MKFAYLIRSTDAMGIGHIVPVYRRIHRHPVR